MERGVRAAAAVGADLLLLALTTRADARNLREWIAGLAERARPMSLGVHLLLNGALIVNGNQDVITGRDLLRVNLRALTVPDAPARVMAFVGDEPAGKFRPGAVDVTNAEAVARWDAESQDRVPE
jgi:hypothetical protein